MNASDGFEKYSRSHALAWTLALLAVPGLYVLTLPPLSLTVYTLRPKGRIYAQPAWLEVYAIPYEWLARNTSMEGWLMVYGDWWSRVFRIRG